MRVLHDGDCLFSSASQGAPLRADEEVSFLLLSRAGAAGSTSNMPSHSYSSVPIIHRAGVSVGWTDPPPELVHSRSQVQLLPLGVVDPGHWERKGYDEGSEPVCESEGLPGGGAIPVKIGRQMNWQGVGDGRVKVTLECFLGRQTNRNLLQVSSYALEHKGYSMLCKVLFTVLRLGSPGTSG